MVVPFSRKCTSNFFSNWPSFPSTLGPRQLTPGLGGRKGLQDGVNKQEPDSWWISLVWKPSGLTVCTVIGFPRPARLPYFKKFRVNKEPFSPTLGALLICRKSPRIGALWLKRGAGLGVCFDTHLPGRSSSIPSLGRSECRARSTALFKWSASSSSFFPFFFFSSQFLLCYIIRQNYITTF